MHHGKQIIKAVTGLGEDSADCKLLYQKLYDDFVEAFDANDNGISIYDSEKLRQAGVEKKFSDRGYSIASVVNRYNYALSTKFYIELTDKFQSWLPARALVAKAFDSRKQYDSGGRILVVPQTSTGGVPWGDHLYNMEEENGCEGQVLYVLFAENGEANSKWRIRAVGLKDSFENRKSLPEAWRGVRDENLSNVAGIPGCVFVHASGFIGGNVTFEGALEMAKKAVNV